MKQRSKNILFAAAAAAYLGPVIYGTAGPCNGTSDKSTPCSVAMVHKHWDDIEERAAAMQKNGGLEKLLSAAAAVDIVGAVVIDPWFIGVVKLIAGSQPVRPDVAGLEINELRSAPQP